MAWYHPEWYRRVNPMFVRRGLRLTAAIYLSVYTILVLPQLMVF